MRNVKIWLLLLLTTGLTLAGAAEISKKSDAGKPDFVIRKVKQQVVLYTIYRGSYDKMGEAIGKLFALAGEKGVYPRGALSCVYLNNPKLVSSEHWLTEIRIPVGEEALKLAGTFGEMTDVKTIQAMDAVVTMKPEGMADPEPIYEALSLWMHKEGYIATEGPVEVFLTHGPGVSYEEMKSEIMVPVKKFSDK